MRDAGIDEALVDALVAATHEHGALAAGELAHHRLVDAPPGGREVHDGERTAHRRRHALGADGRQRPQQRARQQHHAGAAAVGPVVDAPVTVFGEVAQRPQAHVHRLAAEGAPRHALRQVRREELGEERDDVEAHDGARCCAVQ